MDGSSAAVANRTILIAEDSPTQSAQLAHLLEERQFRVIATRNGHEALAALERTIPTLVITDVVMPEMDGYALCRAIKSHAEWKHIPVMLVTTLSDPIDVIRGLECGADNFVRKPYDEKHLLSRVDYLLMNMTMRRNQNLQIGVELTLGHQRHFITSERQQILDLLISTYEQAVQINNDLKRTEQELRHANSVLSALYRIADGLNHAGREQEVSEIVLQRAMELPGVQCGWMLLRDEGTVFRVAATQNLPSWLRHMGAFEGSCACRDLCVAGELNRATNIALCQRLTSAPHGSELRGHVAIPLWLEDRTLGILNLAGPEEGLFSGDEELQVLTNVGNQVALALDRARLRGHLESLVEARTAALRAEVAHRVSVEEATRRLAERLHETLESITDTFISVDREWRLTYMNRQAERLLRRSRENVLGLVLWDELPELVGTSFEGEYRRAMSEGVPTTIEEYFAPLEIWLEVRAYPSAQGLSLYIRDVSEEHRVREEVRKSEERLRMLIEVMPQMVWMSGPDGANMYTNQRWTDYSGLTLEESRGDGWLRAVHPDDRQRSEEAWVRAVHDHGAYEVEIRLRGKDAVYRWCLLRALPMIDSSGEITGWMGTATDIDDMRLALERIAEQAALIDEAHDAIIVRDLDHHILFWSKGAERLYEWSVAQAKGRRFETLLGSTDAVFESAIRDVIQDGAWTGELEPMTASGRRVIVDSRWTLLRDRDRNPKAILTLDTDITERRLAERRLQESEERYRLIFDRNPHPTWVYDLETLAFLAVNDAAVQHYGYTREEFLRMTIKDIRPAEEVPNLLRVLDESPEQEAPRVYGIFKHVKKDLTVIQVEISSSEIVFGGRAAGLVLAMDVTERRRIEQQYLRAQRMESIGTLAGGIAHDLNNLLMPIMMGVTLLKRSETRERNVRALENIERSARRGTDLVKQVLSFARGVEGSRLTVHLADVIHEVQAIVERTFPKNIRLHVDVQQDLSWIEGDPTQLDQVLLNLFVNARDAMPNGGSIRVSARNVEIDEQYALMHGNIKAGQYVLLEVADEGVGIPPQDLDRIFEPFFTTKELGQGTGLGLATSVGIIRSHGGTVSVYSEVGKGSVFKIYLPGKHFDATAQTRKEVVLDELPRGNGELILVVDDEAAILAITQQTLETFGYRVIVAEDGAEAIGLFALHRAEIALLITDMMMPVMDGPALIAAVRRIDPDLSIIGSSGLSENGKTAKASSVGVQHFLNKPYSADVLLVAVAEVLRQ